MQRVKRDKISQKQANPVYMIPVITAFRTAISNSWYLEKEEFSNWEFMKFCQMYNANLTQSWTYSFYDRHSEINPF